MNIYKRKIKYFGVVLGLILLMTNQVNAQQPTSYLWADSINSGDKFTWKIDLILQSNEFLNDKNYNASPPETNSTISQPNENSTSTTTEPIDSVTSTAVETVTIETETTSDTGYTPSELKNGSIISLEVLKDLGTLSLEDPFLDSEWYDESSPVNDYFEYMIDGEINYYDLFPIPIMIIPVEVQNGYADNFFEHELLLDDEGVFGLANKTIEDGLFFFNVNEHFRDNFSTSETVFNVSWDVKTGLLLNFDSFSYYSDEYYIGHNEMKFSLNEVLDNNTELELPVSVISVFSVLLIPILNKIRKNEN